MLGIKNFKFLPVKSTELDFEFDLIGIDASIANAIRRILIAEIPTMAIEKVFLLNNTSLLQDEVLSHRLGLIPIKADPRLFEWKLPDDTLTDLNTIVFKLEVSCRHIREDRSHPAPKEEALKRMLPAEKCTKPCGSHSRSWLVRLLFVRLIAVCSLFRRSRLEATVVTGRDF